VKTISLAESVWAYAEARAAGADEALVLNTAGELCEATTANLFVVRDGTAATPPLESGCLAGITRAHVLELGAVERMLTPADLEAAEEAFLTSSTREIQPLVAVDGRPVGSGEPGPVTRRLAVEYSALVDARLGRG
jgi:branched-subunit amino acid aminotransferase/4-amino-4-deoxychorismate lyase